MPRPPRPSISFANAAAVARAVPAMEDRLVDQLPVDQIRPNPRNPRHKIAGIDELAASIRAYGLLQPVVVRRASGSYELVAGHRRFAAVQQLGWSQVAALVRDETDSGAYLLTLTENLQREDLTAREEAEALEVLVRERGWSTRQVGEAIKRSPMYVSRRLRVFEDDTLAPLVLQNKLAVSTAEELLGVADPDHRKALAEQAAQAGWERRQVRAAARNCIAAIQKPPSADQRSDRLLELIAKVREVLDAGPVTDLTEEACQAAKALATDMSELPSGLS